LNIGNRIRLDLVFVQRYFGRRQEVQESLLTRQQEQQALPALPCTSSSTDTMNVVSWIIRRVKLDDPIYLGDVETSRGNVRAEEMTGGRVAELEEGVGSLLLLLFALMAERTRCLAYTITEQRNIDHSHADPALGYQCN
jgi:hypothetical protein